jgi:hypothetical protein
MRKKARPTAGAEDIQVFELTMDNTEDQDELNRRLRKPGETDAGSPPKAGRTGQGEAPTESTGKRRGKSNGNP